MQAQRFIPHNFLEIIYTFYGFLITYPLIFLSIYAYEITGILATALIYAAAAFSTGIAPIFIAPISDRSGYRIKYASIAVLIGSLLLLSSTFIDERIFILATLIISSAIIQIGQPLIISYETERSKKIGTSVGKVFLFINLGYFLGSIFFGYIIEILGFELSTILESILGMVISLWMFKFKEERIFNENPKKLNLLDVITKTNFFRLFSSSIIIAPAIFFSIVPAYYIFYLKGGIVEWGLINAISTVTGIAASPYVGKLIDKLGIKKVILIGSIYYPTYYILLYITDNILVFAVLYSLPFWLFLWIPLFSYSAMYSNSYERATSVSNINLLIGIFRTLGGILGGLVFLFLGPSNFFIISIALSIIMPSILLVLKEK